MLDLLARDFMSTILNMLKKLKETMKIMYHQIEDISKETEMIKTS